MPGGNSIVGWTAGSAVDGVMEALQAVGTLHTALTLLIASDFDEFIASAEQLIKAVLHSGADVVERLSNLVLLAPRVCRR
jgi:hypothetical protein